VKAKPWRCVCQPPGSKKLDANVKINISTTPPECHSECDQLWITLCISEQYKQQRLCIYKVTAMNKSFQWRNCAAYSSECVWEVTYNCLVLLKANTMHGLWMVLTWHFATVLEYLLENLENSVAVRGGYRRGLGAVNFFMGWRPASKWAYRPSLRRPSRHLLTGGVLDLVSPPPVGRRGGGRSWRQTPSPDRTDRWSSAKSW
jgi:hypothetical protein